jgi:hypothetical protein
MHAFQASNRFSSSLISATRSFHTSGLSLQHCRDSGGTMHEQFEDVVDLTVLANKKNNLAPPFPVPLPPSSPASTFRIPRGAAHVRSTVRILRMLRGYLRLTRGCPGHEDAANEKTRTKLYLPSLQKKRSVQ